MDLSVSALSAALDPIDKEFDVLPVFNGFREKVVGSGIENHMDERTEEHHKLPSKERKRFHRVQEQNGGRSQLAFNDFFRHLGQKGFLF